MIIVTELPDDSVVVVVEPLVRKISQDKFFARRRLRRGELISVEGRPILGSEAAIEFFVCWRPVGQKNREASENGERRPTNAAAQQSHLDVPIELRAGQTALFCQACRIGGDGDNGLGRSLKSKRVSTNRAYKKVAESLPHLNNISSQRI